MALQLSVACKHCKKPIENAQTRRRRYCDPECRHGHWYELHRTPGPTRDDYPELFALLEREAARHEGRVVGYSILWLGEIASGCEFPEKGRVTRRDGIDGSIQFSDNPYFLVTQLPRVPLAATFYRVFVWVQNGDALERVRSEWCEFKRGIRNVHFYDDKFCYYDPTGRYGTKTLQKWPRGERRPLPPGAKRRVRRKKESVSAAPPFVSDRVSTDGVSPVHAAAAVATQVSPADAVALFIPALAAQLEPIWKAIGASREELESLAQRVKRVDARLGTVDPSSASTKTDHVLLSRPDKLQDDFRRLQAELRTEREARASAEAEAKRAAEQAAAEMTQVEQQLAQATAEVSQLRRDRDALVAKQAARRNSVRAPFGSVQAVSSSEPAASRPVDQAVNQSTSASTSTQPAIPSSIARPPASAARSVASSAMEPAEPVQRPGPLPDARAAPPTASEPSEMPSPETSTSHPSEAGAASQPRGTDPLLPYPEFMREVLRQQPFGPPKSTGPQRQTPKKKWR